MSTNQSKQDEAPIIEKKPICGIIMPIAGSLDPNSEYTAAHWAQVKSIITEVIEKIDYTPNLVSDADDVGIIHNRIVTNIADNPIVICDVSSKNPNVMFELGMRLAFDKPTIIIKDELTTYSFDTGVIEHLGYPCSLNYHAINEFKILLEKKLRGTIDKAKDINYTPFLQHFVKYKQTLQMKEISQGDLILKRLDDIENKVNIDKNETFYPSKAKKSATFVSSLIRSKITCDIEIFTSSQAKLDEILSELNKFIGSEVVAIIPEKNSFKVKILIYDYHLKDLGQLVGIGDTQIKILN